MKLSILAYCAGFRFYAIRFSFFLALNSNGLSLETPRDGRDEPIMALPHWGSEGYIELTIEVGKRLYANIDSM